MTDLPYHIVVGMPALSPTMESGTLAVWNVKEGDSFIAGDSLAKIDTDKASIDFEAQDDGHVAKLLVKEGTEDVACGAPIMITVEEAEDVAAFVNYVLTDAAVAPVAKKEEPSPAVSVVAPPPPPPVVVAPAASAAPPPTPPAPPVEAPAVAVATEDLSSVINAQTKSATPTTTMAWGKLAKVHSPLAATLSAQQKKYIETYGTTGQVPL
jgi:pyruvate dehydrogenase E2 component (dihydrolipoamide acetyltransferase)